MRLLSLSGNLNPNSKRLDPHLAFMAPRLQRGISLQTNQIYNVYIILIYILIFFQLCNNSITTNKFYPVTTLEASPMLKEFDDRFINRNFKFGVIYQEKGQVSFICFEFFNLCHVIF